MEDETLIYTEFCESLMNKKCNKNTNNLTNKKCNEMFTFSDTDRQKKPKETKKTHENV